MTNTGHVLKTDPENGRWVLSYSQRPWTVNSERGRGGTKNRGHWSQRAKLVKEWREAFYELAVEAQIPELGAIHVEALQICKPGVMPDTGACYLAVKAAIDGLVDAGVIPNDRGAEVPSIKMWAPEKSRPIGDCLRLLIIDATDEQPEELRAA